VSPEEILHAIAFELGLPTPREASRIELMHAVHDHLVQRHAEGRQVVVFVEESQSMPLATLEEIRLLSNLETRHQKLLQIVLFGQPELDALLAQPGIRQLRERITHGFSLEPLRPDEIGEYLSFRLRAAGYRGPDLFAPKLVRAIADATGGLSRRVNLVADKALLAAFAENTHTLRLEHVNAAVRDCAFSVKEATAAPRWVTSGALLIVGAVLGAGTLWWLSSPSTKPRPSPPTSAETPGPEPSPPFASASSTPAPPALATAPPATEPERTPEPDAGATDTAAARMAATGQWLENADQQRFTIQLALAADDPEELRRFLDHLGKFVETDQLFVYRTRVRDASHIGVAYGSFPTRQAARAALLKLPEAVRSDRPYIRSASTIRREADRSQ
jgi:septal ring-binding cell division protein DamX